MQQVAETVKTLPKACVTQRWVLASYMVRIHDEGPFTVYVYAPPREHRPPHVHVECNRGGEVRVRLGDEETAPSLWQNHHMSILDAREALRIVVEHQARFLAEWRMLHE
jgi:hypothetical protein